MAGDDTEYIDLSTELVDKLRSERARTSVGPQALLKPFSELPKGLNHAMLTHWLGGRVKRVKRCDLDFVLNAWAALGTAPSVKVDAALLAELRALQGQSKITPLMMIKWPNGVPEGLTAAKIQRCLDGQAATMRKDYVAFMRKVWTGRDS